MRLNERLRLAFYAVLISAMIIFSFACEGESGSGGNGGAEPAVPIGASKVIGSTGGTVEVTNPTSPLYGIRVEVPPEALNTDSTISIETTTVSPSHNTGSRASSTIFKLESTNTSYFNIPVTVTVPYDESLVDDESYIGLFIYNPSTDSWQSTTTYEIDTNNNTISAATRHLSLFQVVSIISASIGINVDTGFTPDLNGFQIPNTGGWCYGMSAYSQWFFENKSPNTLYGFYDDITARNVAAESQLKVTDLVNGLLFSLDGIANFVLYNAYDLLCAALSITGKPQLIVMYDLYPFVGHMVVAYAIHDGKVYIYDNNYPGVAPILTPNNFGSFLDYEDYTIFLFVGAAHFFEDFEDIYDKYLLGIEWVQVPAGSFEMGDNFYEGYTNELPVHTVYLDTYYVSKYEVTFDQYDAFCDATGRTKPSDEGWGRGDRPVINVSWNDAKAFCDWLSDKMGENIHLPTEAQWEKAARGTDQRRYPWGDGSPDSSLANYNWSAYEGKTVPVGSYPAGVSPYGIHDMAGNVWEWCADWYDIGYYSSSPTNNPLGPSSGSRCVHRGGGYVADAFFIRSVYRNGKTPSYSGPDFGFRVCKD